MLDARCVIWNTDVYVVLFGTQMLDARCVIWNTDVYVVLFGTQTLGRTLKYSTLLPVRVQRGHQCCIQKMWLGGGKLSSKM